MINKVLTCVPPLVNERTPDAGTNAIECPRMCLDPTVTTSTIRTALIATVSAAALLTGCSPIPGLVLVTGSTPSIPEPSSTPVAEKTINDPQTGSSVTVLAIVTNFTGATSDRRDEKPILVKVRVAAGDVFSDSVGARELTITRKGQDLDEITLGNTNPQALMDAMNEAGFSALTSVKPGESDTGWYGAWVDKDAKKFELVYDRPQSRVIIGNKGRKSGEIVSAYRAIIDLSS